MAVLRGSNGVGVALQWRLDSDSSTGQQQPMAGWIAACGRVASSRAIVSDSSNFETVRKVYCEFEEVVSLFAGFSLEALLLLGSLSLDFLQTYTHSKTGNRSDPKTACCFFC